MANVDEFIKMMFEEIRNSASHRSNLEEDARRLAMIQAIGVIIRGLNGKSERLIGTADPSHYVMMLEDLRLKLAQNLRENCRGCGASGKCSVQGFYDGMVKAFTPKPKPRKVDVFWDGEDE